VIGFGFNLASAFTTNYSKWWGERRGTLVSVILRNILGIPVWAVGFVMAIRESAPAVFPSTRLINLFGGLLIVAGAGIIILALVTIRIKAARPTVQDGLVQSGLYAHIRHPIYAGAMLEFIGSFLVFPTLTVAIACLLGSGWLLLQAHYEEIDLLQRLPGYPKYMKNVPRFLPRWRK
jgi:protein-S-isoprenylcysteine O-methyltransferase Ste14